MTNNASFIIKINILRKKY